MEEARPKPKKTRSRRDVTIPTSSVDFAEMAVPTDLSEVERQLMDATMEDLSSVGSSFTRLSIVDSRESTEIDDCCTELTEFGVSAIEPAANAEETKIEMNPVTVPEKVANDDAYETYHIKMINLFPKFGLTKYVNPELEQNVQFEKAFNESQKLPNSAAAQYLMELINAYCQCRKLLSLTDQRIMDAKLKSNILEDDIWIIERVVVTDNGECQDGNPVSATAVSETANFSEVNYTELKQVLSELRREAEERANVTFQLELRRQQIQAELGHEFDKCVDDVDPCIQRVQLQPDTQAFRGNVDTLRSYISVLFYFLRNVQDDSDLCRELEELITRLNALFLFMGTANDHIFILHHVLRCPPNISDTLASLIQVPVANDTADMKLNDPLITHAIAMLGIILRPVSERDAFLEKLGAESSNSWVILEMDGDIGTETSHTAITEEDLNKLLTQIPLKELFRQIFNVKSYVHSDGNIGHEIDRKTAFDHKDFEDLLALAVFLVGLFERGLRTYHKLSYKQFAKKLCCYIGHVVKHITDVRNIFRSTLKTDLYLWDKLQEQYDTMFERATQAIFSSRDLGAWQFLTTLPYGQVSSTCLWNLYFKLHGPADQDFNDTRAMEDVKVADLVSMFGEIKDLVADDEVYYLLSTYSAMAMDCQETDPFVEFYPLKQDFVFIEFVVADLVKIGTMCERTKESCLKSVRILLANICTRYPSMISIILSTIETDFELAGEDAMYLFQGLPMNMWYIQPSDLDILAGWLTATNLLSCENNLARYVLVNLNFGFSKRDLFLGYDTHCKIAIMIAEAVMRLAPEPIANGGTISTMSNFVRNQANETMLKTWAWDMITRLHLHRLDWDYSDGRRVMYGQGGRIRSLDNVPSLYDDAKLKVLSRGVLSDQPLSRYAATLITEWGHSVPEICHRGFEQLEAVLQYGKYGAVISALQFIVPLFVECPDSLPKCKKFLSVLMGILLSEKSYLKIAKSLITAEQPDSLVMMCHMVTVQLTNYRSFGLPTPAPLVNAWFQSLTRIPNWNNEPPVLQFMDTILSVSMAFPASFATAKEVMRNYRVANNARGQQLSNSGSGGAMGSFMGWISSPNPYAMSLMQTASDAHAIWFAYLAIEIDEEAQQVLWQDVLKLLYCGSETNVETAIKRAAIANDIVAPPLSVLAIYRWANQAQVTPCAHPLLPFVYQRFFSLYLQRVNTSDERGLQSGGTGNTFFLGRQTAILKSMRIKLKECEEYFTTLIQAVTSSNENANPCAELELYRSLKRLFQTYQLWVEEPRLFDHTLDLKSLPVVYDAQKLSQLFMGRKEMWSEYMDAQSLRNVHKSQEMAWEIAQRRTAQRIVPTVLREVQVDRVPLEMLIQRLESYDTPLEPANVEMTPGCMLPLKLAFQEFKYRRNVIAESELNNYIKEFTAKCSTILQDSVAALRVEAKKHEFRVQGHCAVDVTMLDLVKRLYHNCQREIVIHAACHSSPTHERRTCAGPATIRFLVNEAYVEETVRIAVEENRAHYHQVYLAGLTLLDPKVGYAFLQLDSFYRELLGLHKEAEMSSTSWRHQATIAYGLNAFQHLMDLFTVDLSRYPPAAAMFGTQLPVLANAFINGNSTVMLHILDSMLENQYMLKVLSPCLVPTDVSCQMYMEMYSRVVNCLGMKMTENCFVCLSKFDIARWVDNPATSIHSRSVLIRFIFTTLNNAGPKPMETHVMVLELMVSHVMVILRQTFPEHFGEVLNQLLEGSAKQTLAPSMWAKFLLALMNPTKAEAFTLMSSARDQMVEFAGNTNGLSSQLLVETANVLNVHFVNERHQFGLHGLYPKYLAYLNPMMQFISAIMSRLVVAVLNEDRGSQSDTICNVIWPSIELVYWPWVAPCMLPAPVADWIEQLSTRSCIMPWTSTHQAEASRMVASLTDLIRFLLDTLAGCSTPLNYLWSWYSSKFTVDNVNEVVLSVIHQHWSQLPWTNFSPTPHDMKTILTVVLEHSICRSFVGNIFQSVKWTDWNSKIMYNCDNETITTVHICFLHTLVKLATERSFQKSPQSSAVAVTGQSFSWNTIDSVAFARILDAWVTSCDPSVVLVATSTSNLEVEVFNLLLHAAPLIAGSGNQTLHPTATYKQVFLIRAVMKMMANCVALNPNTAADRRPFTLFDMIETAISSNPGTAFVQKVEDGKLMMREILMHANKPGALATAVVAQLTEWLLNKDCSSVVLKVVISIACTDLVDHKAVGVIMETALDSFFRLETSSMTPTWDMVSVLLTPAVMSTSPQLSEELCSMGYALSMYALHATRQKLGNGNHDLIAESNAVRRYLELFKKKDLKNIEGGKVILIWNMLLPMIQRQAQNMSHTTAAKDYIRVLIAHLVDESTKKFDPFSIMSNFGFVRPSSSPAYRTLSRVMSVFLLAQMPDLKGAVMFRCNRDDPGALVPPISMQPSASYSRNINNVNATNPQEETSSVHVINGPVPNSEAKRGLRELEQLAEHRAHAELKLTTNMAVNFIKDSRNTLMDADKILVQLANQYLHIMYLVCLE